MVILGLTLGVNGLIIPFWLDYQPYTLYHMRPRSNIMARRTFLKWLSMAAAVSSTPALGACAPAPLTSPAATASNFNIIPRAEWGAVEPDLNSAGEHGLYDLYTNPDGWRVYDRPLAGLLNTVVVHHSALPLTDGPLQIQHKHMHDQGYADIGYHFVIDAAGQIYEGRSISVRGAHTGGHNTGAVGVCVMGNFEESAPPSAQVASAKKLIQYIQAQYRITHLAGHRDFQPKETVCPGKHLEPLLPGWASDLGLQVGTGGYLGP